MRLRRVIALVLPFVLGSHAVVTAEAEPNDDHATANLVSIGDTVSGHIDPYGDVDWYRIESSAGTVLEVDVDAQVIGSGIDAFLHVYDSTGYEAPIAMLGVNNDDGATRDSRVIVHLPYDGTYYVKMDSPFMHNYSVNHYRIVFRDVPLDETEPNDDRGQADVFPDGRLFAVVAPEGDRDWFAISVDGPAQLLVEMLTDEVGATLLAPTIRAHSATEVLGESGGLHDRVSFFAPAAGTYFIEAFTDFGYTGTYYLTLEDRGRMGPGDPTSVLVHDSPVGALAAGPGVVYARAGEGVERIDLETGARESIVRASGGFIHIRDFAVTQDGELLLLEGHVYDQTPAVVYRITPGGGKEEVLRGAFGYDIEIGWDGNLWITGRSGSVARYSPTTGQLLSQAVTPESSIEDLTIGEGGTPFVALGGAVYRAGSTTSIFERDGVYVHGLAADMNGDLYLAVTNRTSWFQDPIDWGEVWRIDADGTVLEAPVAVGNLVSPYDLLFLVDASGTTTSRLIVSNVVRQARQPVLVEIGAAGVPTPGMPLSGPLDIDAGTLRDAAVDLLGGSEMEPALRSWVDQLGNRNGELDIGDLAALNRWLADHPGGSAFVQGGNR